MAEIGMRRPGRQYQRIVADALAVPENDRLFGRIHVRHLAEQRRHFRPVAPQAADRPGDFRGGDQRRCHLIEQGLEKMVVTPVDEGDANRRAGEPFDELQSAEPAANDDHVMPVLHVCFQLAPSRPSIGHATTLGLWSARTSAATSCHPCKKSRTAGDQGLVAKVISSAASTSTISSPSDHSAARAARRAGTIGERPGPGGTS
ncbi:hypothetical protein D9M68_384190 [compost metagenome]